MIDQADNVFDLNAVLHHGDRVRPPARRGRRRDAFAERKARDPARRWASDAAAVTSDPALRDAGGHKTHHVTIDEVLEALSMLDHKPSGPPGGKPMRQKSTSRVALAA